MQKNKKATNTFAKAFKKSLFKAGDSVSLYNNAYKVMSCNGKVTLLKDERDNPVAYPTEKVRKMILTSKMSEIKKAEAAITPAAPKAPTTGDKPIAQTKAPAPAGTGAHMSTGTMHSGMIRVDKTDSKGHKYHYWVHGTKGSRHVGPDENSSLHPRQLSAKEVHYHNKIKSIIHEHASPEDAPKLEKKFMEFMVAKTAHTNLVEAYNHMQSSKQGNITTNTIKQVGALQDVYQKRFKEFKDALASSKKSNIGVKDGEG